MVRHEDSSIPCAGRRDDRRRPPEADRDREARRRGKPEHRFRVGGSSCVVSAPHMPLLAFARSRRKRLLLVPGSMFTNSSGGSVFFKWKIADEEMIAKEHASAKKDDKAKDESGGAESKSKSAAWTTGPSPSPPPAPEVAMGKLEDRRQAVHVQEARFRPTHRLAKAQELEKKGSWIGAAEDLPRISWPKTREPPPKSLARTASVSSDREAEDRRQETVGGQEDGLQGPPARWAGASLRTQVRKAENTIAADAGHRAELDAWTRPRFRGWTPRQKVAAAFKKTTGDHDLDDLRRPARSPAIRLEAKGGNPRCPGPGGSQDSGGGAKNLLRRGMRRQAADVLSRSTPLKKSRAEKSNAENPIAEEALRRNIRLKEGRSLPPRRSGCRAAVDSARAGLGPPFRHPPVESLEISSKKSLAELFEETLRKACRQRARRHRRTGLIETKAADVAATKSDNGSPVWKSTAPPRQACKPGEGAVLRRSGRPCGARPDRGSSCRHRNDSARLARNAEGSLRSGLELDLDGAAPARTATPMVRAEASKLDSPNADVRKEGILELACMGALPSPPARAAGHARRHRPARSGLRRLGPVGTRSRTLDGRPGPGDSWPTPGPKSRSSPTLLAGNIDRKPRGDPGTQGPSRPEPRPRTAPAPRKP